MAPTFVHLDMVKRTLRAPFQVAAQVRLRSQSARLRPKPAPQGAWCRGCHGAASAPRCACRQCCMAAAAVPPAGCVCVSGGDTSAPHSVASQHSAPLQLIPATLHSLPPSLPPNKQDCWVGKGGAFTGEVSAEMLHDFGIPWVILGHSGGWGTPGLLGPPACWGLRLAGISATPAPLP